MPNSHIAVALIVIDVFISPSGMPSNSCRISPRCGTGTPTLPTSPRASDVVGVVAGLGGEVERDRQPGLPLGQVGAVQLVRRPGRGVPRVRPNEPRSVGHRANVAFAGPNYQSAVEPCPRGGRHGSNSWKRWGTETVRTSSNSWKRWGTETVRTSSNSWKEDGEGHAAAWRRAAVAAAAKTTTRNGARRQTRRIATRRPANRASISR